MVPFVVISYSLLIMVIVVLLLSKKGMESDNNLKRMKSIGKEVVKEEYKNIDTSFFERVIKPKLSSNGKVADNKNKSARQKKQNEALAKKLRKAGIHLSVSSFNFIKLAFMLLSILIFIGIGMILLVDGDTTGIMVILIGVVIGMLGPELFIIMKTRQYQDAIKLQLADTLDLMSVCMEAGLSFDASLVKISERMEGPLIDELVIVFKQIQLGKNRNEALRDLANSTDVNELKTFLSSVIQANQLGIPITNVLNAQSEQLRLNKREEIKTVAAKVPTKMTIPTVLLILPAIFCVILGPVVIQVIDQFKGGL